MDINVPFSWPALFFVVFVTLANLLVVVGILTACLMLGKAVSRKSSQYTQSLMSFQWRLLSASRRAGILWSLLNIIIGAVSIALVVDSRDSWVPFVDSRSLWSDVLVVVPISFYLKETGYLALAAIIVGWCTGAWGASLDTFQSNNETHQHPAEPENSAH